MRYRLLHHSCYALEGEISDFVLADTPIRSPWKICTFTIKNDNYRIKVSQANIFITYLLNLNWKWEWKCLSEKQTPGEAAPVLVVCGNCTGWDRFHTRSKNTVIGCCLWRDVRNAHTLGFNLEVAHSWSDDRTTTTSERIISLNIELVYIL